MSVPVTCLVLASLPAGPTAEGPPRRDFPRCDFPRCDFPRCDFPRCDFPHDGPKHRIEELTRRMAKNGPTAGLLYQRSLCHGELRHYADALADLRRAIALDGGHEGALIERVRVLVALRQPDRALRAAADARAAMRSRPARAVLARVSAEVLTSQRKFATALAETQVALALDPRNAGTILRRSILRGWLRQHAERAAELQAIVDAARAARQPLSPVVEAAWVDALIDAGDLDRALPIVEQRLRESRFTSGWRIRRARIRRARGRTAAAAIDLTAALRELTRRIRPNQPDLLLLADRAVALQLIGRTKSASEDLRALRKRGLPALLLLRLELRLRDR